MSLKCERRLNRDGVRDLIFESPNRKMERDWFVGRR
jgi:hypothetical protein